MTIRNIIRTLQVQTCTLEDKVSVDEYGDPFYSNRREVSCRESADTWTKPSFQRVSEDSYTRLSIDEELPRSWQGRVWLPGENTGDPEKAITQYRVRPVYDDRGRFVHTMLEFG